jgi:hypothetical protein
MRALTTTIMKGSTMATPTVRRISKGLDVSPLTNGSVLARRKTHWVVGADSPRTADQLSFTSRDDEGRICWWSVQPPQTNYWHVHQMLGRAYAFEVLDLLHNPDAEPGNERYLGFIISAIARWLPTVSSTAASGIADGFFSVISEYVATGTASR